MVVALRAGGCSVCCSGLSALFVEPRRQVLCPFVWVFVGAGRGNLQYACPNRFRDHKIFDGFCTCVIVIFKLGSSGLERLCEFRR